MTFKVTGGIYEDSTFQTILVPEEYGPFTTYQEAKDVWKAKMWLNVDNALHRLTIVTG